MWPKLRRFLSLPWRTRLLLLEALLALLFARIAMAVLPFRRIAAWLGAEGWESSADAPADAEARAVEVGRAVTRVAPHVPWDSRCLAQALAGAWMLGRRGIPATLYFGVRKDPEQPFSAHAWLRCGKRIVTGEPEHKTFEVIARFSRTDG